MWSPVSGDASEWLFLMTTETGFLMTTLNIPYLELHFVLGHKCSVYCSDSLVLALKCLNMHLLNLSIGPVTMVLCTDNCLLAAKTSGCRVSCSCRLHKLVSVAAL